MGEWQSIKTAPKDGTRILIWQPSFGRDVLSVVWDKEFEGIDFNERTLKTKYRGAWTDGAVLSFGFETCQSYEPTHWMPLPVPPQSGGEAGG